MADERLDWELKFDDLMSGPLAKINARLEQLDKALGKTASNSLDKALGKQAKDAEAKVAGALDSARAKIVGARADFGKAWAGLATISAPLREKVGAIFSSALERVGGAGTAIRGAFTSVVSSHLGPAFQRASEGAGRWMAPIGKALSSVSSTHFGPFFQRIGEGWKRLGTAVAPFGERLAGIGRSAMTVLGPLGSGLGKAAGAAGNLATVFGAKLGPALSGLGNAAGSVAPMVGTAIVGALAGVTAIAGVASALTVAAGKWAIGGLAFKEDTLVAFKTMLGTQEAADRVFSQATKFAATTPFSTEEVVSGFQRFLVGGFKESELDKLMNAVGDVGANMGTQKMEQVSTALVQIKAKGKLQGEEMMQLAEAGVGQTSVLDALQKNLGISKTEAQARISGGKVTGQQGIDAILEAIRVTQSGGTLGNAMQGKSQTMTGLVSSVLDIPSTLLFATQMDSVVDPIKRALKGLIDAFQADSPMFIKASNAISRIGEAWGNAFEAIANTGPEGILDQLIDGIENFMTKAAPFAEGFFPELMNQVSMLFSALAGPDSSAEDLKTAGRELASMLGTLAGAMLMVGKALAWVFEKLDSFTTWAANVITGTENDDTLQAIQQMNRGVLPPDGSGGTIVPANVTNQNSATVGDVYVQLPPGSDGNAAQHIANQIKGDLPGQLTGFAIEMAGP